MMSAVLVSLLNVVSRRGHALQPLADFVVAARSGNADDKIAALTAIQQDADAVTALGRTLPSVSARFVYTHNQFEAKLDPSQFTGGMPVPNTEPFVIQPSNQLDAYFQLDAPLIDVAGWTRVRAARANARGALKNAEATALDVEKQVARQYYQIIGSGALVEAAQGSLESAEQNLALARARRADGVATDLDIDRATSEVERARQSISDAELNLELSRRGLRTLTGIDPAAGESSNTDDLHEESALASWEAWASATVPQIAAAIEQRRGAESSAEAAKLALVPVISGSAQEHLTNAPGFFGSKSIWTLNLTANWKLDIATWGTLRSQGATAAIARTKESAARQRALDQLHESWFRVHNGIVKSRAARAQADAARSAVARARERFREGVATQPELTQAERDAFSAEVTRIQADADLSFARAALRLDAGHSLEETRR